jgi:hypothetical protein
MAITLTKEDGTGLVNANVYADLADADQYLENSDRKTAWRGSSSKERNAALIQGADYLDQTYRRRYKGERFSSTQRLEWPRVKVFDELGNPLDPLAGVAGSVPEEVGNASIEYAFEAAIAPLAPTPQFDDTGRQILSIREKVDVLETATSYQDGKGPAKFKPFPRAELVIRRWLNRAIGGLTARI